MESSKDSGLSNNLFLQQDPKFKNLEDMSAQELLNLAEENYETMEYDNCKVFYEEAIKKEPQNEYALCSYGYFLVNTKQIELAQKVLAEAIYLNPDGNAKKYLHMAQLYEGIEAETFYLKAIDILTNQIQAYENNNLENKNQFDLHDAQKDLSQSYSALGELYMTDLVKAENAAKLCGEYLMKAVEINPFNLDAYYQLANYFLEVDNPEHADESLAKLIEIYKEKQEKGEDDFFDEFPEEMYVGLTKILVETQRYADALLVSEDLLEDDSNNMEILYMACYCNFMLKNYMTAQEYLEEFNSKLKLCNDEEILTAKEELEAELKKVDVTKGNDYEEAKEEGISGTEDMDLESQN
jgi:tetratricopeptide (TPR) repeat protein